MTGPKDGDRDGLALLAVHPLTTTERRSAAIQVCGHTPTPAEARMLLHMLGLLADDGAYRHHPPGNEWTRAPGRLTGTVPLALAGFRLHPAAAWLIIFAAAAWLLGMWILADAIWAAVCHAARRRLDREDRR
jgi:hypothetical protein